MLWRAIGRMMMALTCTLAALSAIALVDYGWGLPHAARAVLLSLVLLAALIIIARPVRDFARRRMLTDMAREVEQAAGSRWNALVTFSERIESAELAAGESYMLARLERQARTALEELDERVVAPREAALRGGSALLFMLLLIFALKLTAPLVFAREFRRVLWLAGDDALSARLNSNAAVNVNGAKGIISVDELRVRVVPPAYSALSVEEVSGDAPVRVLSGSQIEVVMRVGGGAVEDATLSFNGVTNHMRSLGGGSFSGAFTANASGAFEARVQTEGEERAPVPIVRAVEVYADAPPEARIVEPASDQLFRSVPTAPLTVRWTARDDLGLSGARLKYIKSRGEGDSAKFTNGEASVGNVSRTNGREWQGVATLDLQRLDMQPGDTLVFWIEARDRNASANNTGRSASIAVAIAGAELAKLNLSDLMPNEIGRFLLSQRAIIMHTEKLHGERARLTKDELVRRSNSIAAEQREFKNSFTGYIHVEGDGGDEGTSVAAVPSIEEQVRAAEDERTTPHFHGIPEPPSAAPTAVKEMTYAIRAMWDAEDALVNGDTTQALKFEREALLRLKHAQGATRYVPPIVAQSKPVDLKRRYAGELEEIKTRMEKLARPRQSPATIPLRQALADLYAALNDLQETLGVAASVRASAVGRASQRARAAADRLIKAPGGDHAATMAEAAGQLRVVEVELSRIETGGSVDEYATRLAKPLALLAQAASNLFAIAESSTRSLSNDANSLLPTDDARAADYFRRLAGGR
jgi:hypothetical protein